MHTTTTTPATAPAATAAPALDLTAFRTVADCDAQLATLATRRAALVDRRATVTALLAEARETAAAALASGAELPGDSRAARVALAQEFDDLGAAIEHVDAMTHQLREARRPVERAEAEATLDRMTAERVAYADQFNRLLAPLVEPLLAIAAAYDARGDGMNRQRSRVQHAGGEPPQRRADWNAWSGAGNPSQLVSILREHRAHYAALLAGDDASAAR